MSKVKDMSVDETISAFILRLSESTGFKYLKSRRALKNTVGPIVFEILFFSSKWNSEGSVEINANLRISYKKYGAASTAQSTIASVSFNPDGSYWYDILLRCSLILPQGLIINNYILRRVLFEQVQHIGDCSITGRFAGNQNKPPALMQLKLTIFRRKNNE